MSNNNLTDIQIEELIKYYLEEGHNASDAQKKFNIKQYYFLKIMNMYNIPLKPKSECTKGRGCKILADDIAEKLIEYYKEHSDHQTCTYFHISSAVLFRTLEKYNICKHSKEDNKILRSKSYKQTCIERYGQDNIWKTELFRIKLKNTSLQKYGVENPNQADLVKQHKKETFNRKYGVDNCSQIDFVKDKKRVTSNERYGVDYPMQSEVIKNKLRENNFLKFGGPAPMCNEEIKNKRRQTCLEKYGEDNPHKNKEIIEKTKNTCLTKYGYTSTALVPEIREQQKLTQWKNLNSGRYKKDDAIFDSLPELAFYIYNLDKGNEIYREPIRLEYSFNNEKHIYFPDFMVNNTLVEIKNSWLYNLLLIPNTQNNAKYQCMLNHKVFIILEDEYKKYLEYCEDKYGKKWFENFKNI